MDPITALALAGNVLQFLEFSRKLIAKASKIHKDGSVVEYTDLQVVTDDLCHYTEQLRAGLITSEPEFHNICDGCLHVAQEMSQAIQALDVTGKPSKWKSFRQAFKSVWGKEHLAELKSRLDLYSDQMDRRMLVSIRARVDVVAVKQTEQYTSLDCGVRVAVERITHLEEQILQTVHGVEAAREKVVSTMEKMAADNREGHKATRDAMTDFSTKFQHDSGEVAMLATECLGSLKLALTESRQHQHEILTLLTDGRADGNREMDELRQEIQGLKVALEQTLQQMAEGHFSSEEEKQLKDNRNAICNLWVAKELVLSKIMASPLISIYIYSTNPKTQLYRNKSKPRQEIGLVLWSSSHTRFARFPDPNPRTHSLTTGAHLAT